MGIPSLTVTNVPGSTLSRGSDSHDVTSCRARDCSCFYKAYTAQIATLAFLRKAVERYANGNEKAKSSFDLVHELSIVAQAIEATLSEKDSIDEKVRGSAATTRNAFYIGRGQDYYVAMEASLKLKKFPYIQCGKDLLRRVKHGTISLIEDRYASNRLNFVR